MNIFNIEESLLELYSQIEENGGEITDEIAEELEVTQDNFREKIKGYVDVIKEIDGSLASIKCEQDRLKSLETSKKKVKERLSSIIATAVTMFGDTTKSGGKFFDYGTGKVSVRNNTTCEVDDEKLSLFHKALIHYIDQCNKFNTDYIDSTTKEMIETYINDFKHNSEKVAEFITGERLTVENCYVPTVADIDNTEINIDLSIPLSTIMANTEDTQILFKLLSLYTMKTKCVMSKKGIKESLNNDALSNIANIKQTQSITIK